MAKMAKKGQEEVDQVPVWKPIICLAGGLLLFVLGAWATHLYIRFTPVYTDMVCELGHASLRNMKLGVPAISPSTFTIEMQTKCDNPNFYTIGFAIAKKGQVFMGQGKTPVGWAMASPESRSHLPAHGNGSIWAVAEVSVSGPMLVSLTGDFLGFTGVPVYLELNMQLKIDISFFFGSFSVHKWVMKKCGLMIGSLITSVRQQDNKGPMACADSWDELVVPRLTDTGSDKMVMSSASMDPEEIQRGALAKNIGLGLTMVLAYTSALALAMWSLCLFRNRSGGGYRRKHNKIASRDRGASDDGNSDTSETPCV